MTGWRSMRPKGGYVDSHDADVRAAYYEVFTSPSGEVVLRDLYNRFYKKDIFAFDSPNCALEASHAAGQREILEAIEAIKHQHVTGE